MSLTREFQYELHRRFTGEIHTDAASKILYSTDASMYQIEPLGVAIPRTQEDLIAAVELAARYKVPILPRGAGTSLGGQAVGAALILDCSRWLDSILELDPVSRTALVEPGVVLSTLNLVAAQYGLMFGPDPASAERATLGGVIGNNATGAHSILYGMTADHLLSADIILGDGSLETWDANRNSALTPVIETIRARDAEAIRQNFPKTWRNSAGYRLNYLLPWSPSAPPRWVGAAYPANLKSTEWNLAPLLAGSEGTLAVLRRARVQLVPKPKFTVLGVLAYPGNAEACDDVPRLLEFQPSAIELIPRMILRLARTVPAYARQMGWVTGDPAAVLVVEFSGDDPQALKATCSQIGPLMTLAETPEEQARIWNIRKVGLGILDSRPRAARPVAFIEDCAIPVERLGEFVREVEQILTAHAVEGGMYAHASAGCLHIRPLLDLHSGAGVQSMRSISTAVFALTMRLGGSMSSEHGDGIATGEWVEQTYGAQVTDLMRRLKQTADPHALLNPGKLFAAPPFDTHLRFDNPYHPQTWVPALRYEHERGLAGAIEQCNGQGVCRKTTGVMCPSFQATREEMNSTRGRANLLRAFIAQPAAVRGALEDDVARALDLCLACKGCTAECPSGVDMPRLKYEFENQYYKTHRRPLRDYVFGYFHLAARLAALVAPLTNWLMMQSLVRSAAAHMLQIAPQRPFPKFASPSARPQPSSGKKILFLSDPFARYVEPETEQAAFDVLALCGYEVHVLPVVGAGAALLSKGLVAAAKRQARTLLAALKQADPQGEAVIVGIEPPEVYCLKHEYVSLLPALRDEIASYASRTWLLDEYLLRSPRFRSLSAARAAPGAGEVFFHPHCHQRAEGPAADGLPAGAQATRDLLQLCGYQVTVSDAGCCGMAGTFGYEAEHYELSMQVGELKLFPALRALPAGRTVVGSGAACRLQMTQGGSVQTGHPLEWVRAALTGVALGNEIEIQQNARLGLQ